MAVLRADIIGKELCKAWGIDSMQIRSIHIILAAGGVAEVQIQRYLDTDDVLLLEKYKLVKD